MKRTVFIIILALCLCLPASAQLMLSLQDAVSMAQGESFDAQRTTADFQKGFWDFNHHLSLFKPHLEFDINPTYVREGYEYSKKNFIKPVDNDRLSTLAQLKLNQRVSALGGDFYATSTALWSEFFKPYSGFDRLFGAQPIMVGYEQNLIGYNPYKWEKKIESAKMDEVQKKKAYDMWDIARKTAALYMNVLRAESLYNMYLNNASTSEVLYKIGQEKFNNTSIRNDELSSLKLQWMNANTSCSLAKVDMDNARSELVSYLGLEDGSALMLSLPAQPSYLLLDHDRLYSIVKDNNPVYSGSNVKRLEARNKEEKARREKGVQASMDVSVGIQNYAQGFGQAYANPAFSSLSGVTVRIPIIDQKTAVSKWNAAKYEAASVDAKTGEELRSLNLDLDCAIRDFENYQTMLQSAQATMELADEAYSQANDNYANGIADINTFAIAQSRKENAYSNYLDVLCCYWDAYYRLSMLCCTDIAVLAE